MSQAVEKWVVLKFGGTSVAARSGWDTVASIVRARLADGLRPLVVHSAVAGVTDRLDRIATAAASDGVSAELESVEARHKELASALAVDGNRLLAPHLGELHQLIAGIALVGEASPRVRARVLALGELMASTLGAAFLIEQGIDCHWCDARQMLCAEPSRYSGERNRYLSASCGHAPDAGLDAILRRTGTTVLTQGYIARNADDETVLLGRGGSDTTAAYLAAKLDAVRVENWTDVPGMFSADPRLVPEARLLRSLDYAEAQEIATTGGAVIHPRSFAPLKECSIPLSIHCTGAPDAPGTRISASPADTSPRVKAVSVKKDVVLVSMETSGMWHSVGFLADAFGCFKAHGMSIDLVSTSETNVTVSLDSTANALDDENLDRLIEDLKPLARVRVIRPCAAISLVGRQIRAILHQLGPALELFEEHPVHLVSQAASDLNFTVVVDESQADRLVQKLHGLMIKPLVDDPVLGPTRGQIFAATGPAGDGEPPWWVAKRDALIKVAPDDRAAYVYDLWTVSRSIETLKGVRSIDRILYAMKANAHPGVLGCVRDAGLSFECVSPGELDRVLSLEPFVTPERILFTPNFAPRAEYEYALGLGVQITLDNVYALEQWPDIFRDRSVFLRIDPGQGRGHHRHVRTAGAMTKFGVPLAGLAHAAELARANNTRIAGLHAHAGSGILDADHWQDVAKILADAAMHFPDVTVLNLGGGLGVPDRPSDPGLDCQALDESLGEIKRAMPDFELWMEPGRFLVASAGVLLARVTQTKGKGDTRYVGLNTGMNSLIRPALYGSWHEIVNLTRHGDPAPVLTNVVGPICESSDSLGVERLLPESAEGDVFLIANAGAYGSVMSSAYNLREPATELVLDDTT